MSKTLVVWNTGEPAEFIVIQNKLAELISEGVTDGSDVIETLEDAYSVTRTWINQEAAQNWVNFILDFNPDSAIVLEE
jgi:hypothetical protein